MNQLIQEVKQSFDAFYHDHTDLAYRRRARAILQSRVGFSMSLLQNIFAVDHDTVSEWLD